MTTDVDLGLEATTERSTPQQPPWKPNSPRRRYDTALCSRLFAGSVFALIRRISGQDACQGAVGPATQGLDSTSVRFTPEVILLRAARLDWALGRVVHLQARFEDCQLATHCTTFLHLSATATRQGSPVAQPSRVRPVANVRCLAEGEAKHRYLTPWLPPLALPLGRRMRHRICRCSR
jgi:hypothetical protein